MKELHDTLLRTPLSIITASRRQTHALVERLNTISEERHEKETWAVVADSLTPPECLGIITTRLTQALHSLLSKQAHIHVLVPKEAAKTLLLPDPKAYGELTLRFTVGQRLHRTDIIHALVQAGYVRNQKTIESGGLRVRGEAVDVSHPILPGLVTIIFHGSAVESIIQQHGRVSRSAARVLLPPMKFPAPEVSLENFKKSLAWQAVDIPPLLIPQTSAAAPSPISRDRALELLSDLAPGKPAVHTDHGIGIYEGLHIKEIEGAQHEYLIIQYAQGDLLYVPVEFAHKVTPYLGEGVPRIHRLGGTLWAKTKSRAREEAAAFAKELLTIAGRRQESAREPYQINESVENELALSFPYVLTPDQERTWHEVKQDLLGSRPLDRVVVGDVGFGKTEIAIRAARHAIENNKQVAIVAPTTLLVQQHTDTFRARLRPLTSHIAMLSRATSAKEVRKIEKDIASGAAKIVIGTHALLSPRLAWKNLGLVIIDEEQKFGVRQKEHFKKMRAEVDLISLSATPIPRTLASALSGLRDLSLIHTAPASRLPVKTRIATRHDDIVRQALENEIKRGGQAYVVASKIRYLSAIREHLAALAPSLRLAVAHGRLPAKKLAEIMHQFDMGEIDVLVSSNIVENGLDLPNVNTMIVWNATHFGLSDLYQLRGRVGRRERQGYAYFFYDQSELTGIQRERLAALTEASRLGSGWSIARRDLEIRGAGNLLGKEQSGTANEVGVQLYLDLVRQATQDPDSQDHREVEISLPLTALLPLSYIPKTNERARAYQRLSRSQSLAQLKSHQEQLAESFGPLPPAARNLILILELQHVAKGARITKIDTKKISPPDQPFFYRLIVQTPSDSVPLLAAALQGLGTWTVRESALQVDVPAITPDFVHALVQALRVIH